MTIAGRRVSILPGIFILIFFATVQVCASYAQGTFRPGNLRPDPVDDKVAERIGYAGKLVIAKRYDEAIAVYKTAHEMAGRPVFTIYMNMGYAYYEKGDYTAAANSYKQAAAIRPDDWSAYYSLAESLFAAGQYREAEIEYRRVLTFGIDPLTKAKTNNYLGLSLYKQKRIEQAIPKYKIAIELLNSHYSEAHNNLGTALMENKEYEAAEREFRLAIEQEQGFAEAYFNLAISLEHLQRFREAAEQYESYLKLNPGAEGTEKLLERIKWLKEKK